MIAIASDHGGFELRHAIMKHLDKRGLEYVDCGCDTPASCDYPDYAKIACGKVISGECDKAILICGTGIGISISANKIPGIRAALCGDCYSARFTRMHNDANVLCLGAFTTGHGLALDIVDAFLSNEFEGGRHQTRVDMVMALEESEFGK